MEPLITFWSHALAAVGFAALTFWHLGSPARESSHRLLLAALALTACWAWLTAIGTQPLALYAETARNLVWIALLYRLWRESGQRQHGVGLVYGAVAATIGLQAMVDALAMTTSGPTLDETATLLRITTAAGSLVLVHNVYGQTAPSSRAGISLAMLGLTLLWGYDLNLYTLQYLGGGGGRTLWMWRGAALALTVPLFAIGGARENAWRIRPSRAATFQSLSLLAICAYFAVMAIVATALRGSGWDWSTSLLVVLLAIMTVAAMVLLPSARARSWAKMKLSQHLFEHRFDYRTEWLRFTGTLGDAAAAPLGERIVRAFADILDSPGGLLMAQGESGSVEIAGSSNWPGANPHQPALEEAGAFWSEIAASGRIIELDAVRGGWARGRNRPQHVPEWLLADASAWLAIPLLHHDELAGLVVLVAPDYRRSLDWEDFDLLRTAGRQAASSLAELQTHFALDQARRFDEFNRRFAFIMHDLKNVVSQLSLLSRNAERHADNPDFRSDMLATLRGSVGKMQDLLARLSPHAATAAAAPEAQPLRPLLSAAVAAKRRQHDVRLLGETDRWARVNADGLAQALSHLIQNAIDASPEGEAVTVRVSERGADICIAILDKGRGMDAEFVRAGLFQPFVSTKNGGFGIGAFEARSLVRAMGGRLSVDSAPGQGSTFSILLPAAEPAETDERKSA